MSKPNRGRGTNTSREAVDLSARLKADISPEALARSLELYSSVDVRVGSWSDALNFKNAYGCTDSSNLRHRKLQNSGSTHSFLWLHYIAAIQNRAAVLCGDSILSFSTLLALCHSRSRQRPWVAQILTSIALCLTNSSRVTINFATEILAVITIDFATQTLAVRTINVATQILGVNKINCAT